MEKIKKIPFAFSGVMLGMAALGNLLQSYGEGIRLFFGGIASVILLLLLLKLVLFPNAVKEELSTPIGAGVFATFPAQSPVKAIHCFLCSPSAISKPLVRTRQQAACFAFASLNQS